MAELGIQRRVLSIRGLDTIATRETSWLTDSERLGG